jgi:hypothetical protein
MYIAKCRKKKKKNGKSIFGSLDKMEYRGSTRK